MDLDLTRMFDDALSGKNVDFTLNIIGQDATIQMQTHRNILYYSCKHIRKLLKITKENTLDLFYSSARIMHICIIGFYGKKFKTTTLSGIGVINSTS